MGGPSGSRFSRSQLAARSNSTTRLARKSEDIESSSTWGKRRQVRHGPEHAETAGRIAGVHAAGYQRADPASYTAEDRNILMPVRPAIADRLTDDAALRLVLPEQLARPGVERLEPA